MGPYQCARDEDVRRAICASISYEHAAWWQRRAFNPPSQLKIVILTPLFDHTCPPASSQWFVTRSAECGRPGGTSLGGGSGCQVGYVKSA